MTSNRRALFIRGDFHTEQTTSATVVSRLAEKFTQAGWTVRSLSTGEILRKGNCSSELSAELEQCQLLLTVFSSSRGSMPPQFVKILEAISSCRTNEHGTGLPRFAAVACCAQESCVFEDDMELCRFFAKGTGMTWSGGVSITGYYTGGKPLSALGPLSNSLRRGLDAAAEALINCQPVPEQARELSANADISSFMTASSGCCKAKKTASKV